MLKVPHLISFGRSSQLHLQVDSCLAWTDMINCTSSSHVRKLPEISSATRFGNSSAWNVFDCRVHAKANGSNLAHVGIKLSTMPLSYINRDIKERIQDQLLSIIDLTSSGLDIVSRIFLAQRGVVKHLNRLLGSNTMAISDLACAALANFVCVLSSKDECTTRAQLNESVEQVRGTRGLKELLLSPLVSESGPGPTKHASRVFINMLFPQHQVICQVRDVWEGYILTEPALRPSVDEDLDHLKQLDGVWDISYRHCSGQDYNHLVVETAATPRGEIHGSGRDNKGQSIKLTGTLTSKPGVHNCEFSFTFDNQGKPYGPRPILHIGFWSSLHRDRIWGVWEVGTSPDQHKLGTGGIFLIKVQQAQTSQGQ
ncbi:hypothetical protein LEN26_006661 [Aphanomyces euteiches]|nr:hypothetical protein LEN26_006661 [Aphanomyces euteiches]